MQWQLIKRPLSVLKEWPDNPRCLTKKGMADLKKSIEKFGCAEPLVINTDDTICGGHGRKKTLEALGVTEVDCYVPERELTPEEFKELNVRLNRDIAGEWDMDKLANCFDIGELKEWGFEDKDFFGAMGPELKDGQTDPDDTPEPPAEPKTKLGDLYILGDHRLLCGDSSDTANIALLLNSDKASCVFTDPPYGVSIGAKNRMLNSFQKAGRNLVDIESDDLLPEELKQKLLPVFKNVSEIVMADDCTVFVTAPQGGELGMMMMMMMQEACLRPRHVLIWKKNSPTFSMGRLDYDYAHEPILLTWGKRHKRPMLGQHKTSVWEIDKPRANKEHPTMKPVELYVNAYLNNSDSGDITFDPYAGSGTAIIASEQTGRKCRSLEISPAYCDVIVERWEKFTGKQAVKEGD